MIFDKSLKFIIKDELERTRKYVEREHANVIAKGVYIKDRLGIFLVLEQINCIIERFYSDVSEEILNDEYNELREKILDWYETINTKPEK